MEALIRKHVVDVAAVRRSRAEQRRWNRENDGYLDTRFGKENRRGDVLVQFRSDI